MGEKFCYDKKESGCNVYITVFCGKDEKYPCYKHEEKKPYKDDYKKIDWRKYEDKKCYEYYDKKEPRYEKNNVKRPGFVGGYAADDDYDQDYEA